MEKIDILLWVVGSGFTMMFALMLVMWNSLNKRMDKLEEKMDKLEEKIGKLEEKVHELDKRLCRIEGILHTQDCCAIKASNEKRQAQ